MNRHTVFALSAGFIGGIVANAIISAAPVIAASAQSAFYSLQILDTTGRKTLVDMTSNGGAPLQDFYDSTGKLRMQFGTYNAGSEAGQPLIGLFDNGGNIRAILRLAGPGDSPVLVIKDKSHQDRIVMGLSMDGKDEPFLSYTDANGTKHNVFGNY